MDKPAQKKVIVKKRGYGGRTLGQIQAEMPQQKRMGPHAQNAEGCLVNSATQKKEEVKKIDQVGKNEGNSEQRTKSAHKNGEERGIEIVRSLSD